MGTRLNVLLIKYKDLTCVIHVNDDRLYFFFALFRLSDSIKKK